MVVGRRLSYWEGNFSGAMLNFRGVYFNLALICYSNNGRSSEVKDAETSSSTGTRTFLELASRFAQEMLSAPFEKTIYA